MEKIENFSYVQMSCRLAFIALTELGYLTKERSQDQIGIVESHTFQYYKISMQYMFVMEFTKILEADTKDRIYSKRKWEDDENQNFSSLQKLSRRIKDSLGASFASKHEENKQILEEVRRSEFYNYIKTLRDKEFAHTNGNKENPLNIISFSTEKIMEAFKSMEMVKRVLNNCTSGYNYDFFFDYQDRRTDNFIAYHALYKSFYDKHLNQAINEGFHIKPKI